MAILKVLGTAVAVGMLFVVAGAALTVVIEKSVGRSATLVITGIGCVGLLLGGIAGAAQAVVDALRAPR
jgi:hypothetical protein